MTHNHAMQGLSSNDTIAHRLQNTYKSIQQVAEGCQRNATDVRLMAVSKTKPQQAIVDAYANGQRCFGENYAQELAEKSLALAHLDDIEWHFIGPIQSNKTKLIAEHSDWIDSVDRLKIAQRLDNHCQDLNKTLNILVQVNISHSEAKSGMPLADVPTFIEELSQLHHLTVRGLMAIPDAHPNSEQTRTEFMALNACFLALKSQYPSIDTLSIGMSGDWPIAVECGSTLIRIGSAIFGERS